MLIPALIGSVFAKGDDIHSRPSFHTQSISPIKILEVKELLPQITETIELAQVYYNNLEEGKGDRLDELVAGVIADLRSLEKLLLEKKRSSVLPQALRIRRSIETFPRLATYVMYHSREPGHQSEISALRTSYEEIVKRDSFLGDILIFLKTYCITRSQTVAKLNKAVTDTVEKNLK